MTSRRFLPGLVLTLAFALTSCTSGGCTLVGGESGVLVKISRALQVEKGAAHFEACDDEGCASAQTSADDIAFVSFEELGRSFDAGPVTATVELVDRKGTVVGRTRQTVELERSYPNGKSCDGEGYVNGELLLRRADRV